MTQSVPIKGCLLAILLVLIVAALHAEAGSFQHPAAIKRQLETRRAAAEPAPENWLLSILQRKEAANKEAVKTRKQLEAKTADNEEELQELETRDYPTGSNCKLWVIRWRRGSAGAAAQNELRACVPLAEQRLEPLCIKLVDFQNRVHKIST